MNRLISILLSAVTALTGLFMTGFTKIPSYIENIDEENVCRITENAGYVKDTVLVVFEEDASFFEKLSVFSKADGYCTGTLPDLNLYVLKTGRMSLEETDKLCKNLTSLDSVVLASICPVKKLSEQYTPDDPFIDDYNLENSDWDDENPEGNNWHLEAIDARSAWGYNSLFKNIDIGIVDGGFDTSHEELAGKITFPSRREERRNRGNHHGTHVAGIIAAEQNNGVGISGVCPNSTLICVDWSPSDGQLWIGDIEIFNGFIKTVKAGAKVINFSVGSSSSINENKYEYPKFIMNLDAMLYSYAMGSLMNKGYDFVVVQSAGNGNGGGYAVDAKDNGIFACINENNTFLPFKNVEATDLLDRIIIVGNADISDDGYVQSDSSNVGDSVDICAPGSYILSTTKDNTYSWKSGTSMSAPVVTGVASLVWSLNNELTGADVKRLVYENTKDVVLPSSERQFEFLNYRSYPMVNAKLAVEATLRETMGYIDTEFTLEPYQEISLENMENGNTFHFEADSQGKVTCVLQEGEYFSETDSAKWITVVK